MAPWQIGLIVGDVVAALLIAGGIIWIVLRTKDEKAADEVSGQLPFRLLYLLFSFAFLYCAK